MPLLASRHAAFETVGQIGIANFVDSIDGLLLDGVCLFHFELSGHDALSASYYSIDCGEP
jgi:hypothetical protein